MDKEEKVNRFLTEMAGMSRKHFQDIADVLKDHKQYMHPETHKNLVHDMARMLKHHNDLFQHEKFMKAAGVDKE